jgi:hypothetical protein
MTTIDITTPVTIPGWSNAAPAATLAEVHVEMSWQFRDPSETGCGKFDPREAGRRAVAKHADALRRLSS